MTRRAPIEGFAAELSSHGARLIGSWEAEARLCACAVPGGQSKARELADALWNLGMALSKEAGSTSSAFFRAVGIDRLPTVWNRGCDVEPTSAAMFASMYADKVFEYGGWPKMIQIFDGANLRRSWREVPVSTPLDALAEIEKELPTRLPSVDGQFLWFSRFPAEHHGPIGYEQEWGRWIPGDPFEALLGILLLVTDEREFRAIMSGPSGISLEW